MDRCRAYCTARKCCKKREYTDLSHIPQEVKQVICFWTDPKLDFIRSRGITQRVCKALKKGARNFHDVGG